MVLDHVRDQGRQLKRIAIREPQAGTSGVWRHGNSSLHRIARQSTGADSERMTGRAVKLGQQW